MEKRLVLFFSALFLSLSASFAQSADTLSSADALRFIRAEFQPFSEMITRSRVQVPLLGNSLEIMRGMRKHELLTDDIGNASECINFEYYEFGTSSIPEQVREMLMEKARDSVTVRFLAENITNAPRRRDYYRDMRSSGMDVRFFSPITRPLRFLFRLNHRNHQKIAVIDNRIAYIGGMNMDDRYFKDWDDTHMRIEGPAAAVGVNGVFWKMWEDSFRHYDAPSFADTVSYPAVESVGKIVQVVSDGPLDGMNIMEDAYKWLLDNSTGYFYVNTPYFAPPRGVRRAMKAAASRGADIRIMLPGESDVPIMDPVNRSFYRTLLRSGVRIYSCDGRFNHSKTFVTDDYLFSIGSVNLDYRSFRINYEDNAFVYDSPVAAHMKAEFETGCAESCREVTLQEVYDWSIWERLLYGLVRLIAFEM